MGINECEFAYNSVSISNFVKPAEKVFDINICFWGSL